MHIPWEAIERGPPLGVGTVGTVYRARLKTTGQAVAVKILQEAISHDPIVRARFQREMQILERLEHPNIVHYYGDGKRDGQLYYVMELMEFGTVKDLLEQTDRLKWEEVASIARQTSSALQHAHNQGIIHRDLKPGNLFLSETGQIKLGDFGIARDTHSADLTHQGMTVGTHAYMSPEQIVGDQDITGKTDLYALGCVMFELLTGRKPFEGANFAQLFEQHLHAPAPRVRDFVPNCPEEIDSIVAQLLEKSPDARPFNARVVQGVMLELLSTPKDYSYATSPSTHAETSRDVSASIAVDVGMESLRRRLQPPTAPQVSWKAVSIVAILAILIVAIVSLAA